MARSTATDHVRHDIQTWTARKRTTFIAQGVCMLFVGVVIWLALATLGSLYNGTASPVDAQVVA